MASWRAAVALTGVVLGGCGGSSPTSPPDNSWLMGEWSGRYDNTSPNGPPSGTLTLRFTEVNPAPRGSCTFVFGGYTVRNAALTASLEGSNRVTITSCGSNPCGYTGTVTRTDANTLAGDFQGGAGCPSPSAGSTQGDVELHR